MDRTAVAELLDRQRQKLILAIEELRELRSGLDDERKHAVDQTLARLQEALEDDNRFRTAN